MNTLFYRVKRNSDDFGATALKRMLVILGCIPKDPLAIAGFTRATETLVGWLAVAWHRFEAALNDFIEGHLVAA